MVQQVGVSKTVAFSRWIPGCSSKSLSCTPDVYMVHEQSVGSLEINLNSFPFFGGPYSGVIPLQGHPDLKKRKVSRSKTFHRRLFTIFHYCLKSIILKKLYQKQKLEI